MRSVAVLTLAGVLLAARAADAKYQPPSFAECVFGADVVVVGRIETLRQTDYDFRVEEWLVGANPAETLRIQRFEDWTCAQRDPPYAPNQRFVAFLRRGVGGDDDADPANKDRLSSIGGGCEGDVILEGGSALASWKLGEPLASAAPLSDARFVGTVRTLLAGYREVGAPGFADAWRKLIGNADPIVAATALGRLDAEAVVNPQPASAFADALVGAVAHPDRGVRLLAASRLGDWLGSFERFTAANRLADASRTAPPPQRPAAALAKLQIDPAVASRHADLICLLADESVPLAERDAVAESLADGGVRIPKDLALAGIDPVAREAVACISDPSLLLHLCAYLGRLRGRVKYPSPRDAEFERGWWLQLLDSTPKREPTKAAPEPPPKDDPYLSPTERAVLVPRDAEKRPLTARIVRAVRRARNAERAGDAAAALDSYRDALSAAVAVTDGMRPVLLALGVDFEIVGRDARALDARTH